MIIADLGRRCETLVYASIGLRLPTGFQCWMIQPRLAAQSMIEFKQSARRMAIGRHESRSNPVQGMNGERLA